MTQERNDYLEQFALEQHRSKTKEQLVQELRALEHIVGKVEGELNFRHSLDPYTDWETRSNFYEGVLYRIQGIVWKQD